MKENIAALAVPLFFSIGMTAGPVLADGQGNRLFIDRDVDTFAVLPDGVQHPEGKLWTISTMRLPHRED